MEALSPAHRRSAAVMTSHLVSEQVAFPKPVSQSSAPGILVFGPSMKVGYLNQHAWALLHILNALPQGSEKTTLTAARKLLPPSLLNVCGQVFRHLHRQTKTKEWEQRELMCRPEDAGRSVRIRAFGIPGPTGHQVVIMLEEVTAQAYGGRAQWPQGGNLTLRETDVVQCLAKGWTNKEIAVALKLAVPTVKEHVRHIMEKTHTTTRTGILVQLFAPRELASSSTGPARWCSTDQGRRACAL